MRKLSRCKRVERYAYCSHCKEVFIDDDIHLGNIGCPNGCYNMLQRGLNKNDVRVKTYRRE